MALKILVLLLLCSCTKTVKKEPFDYSDSTPNKVKNSYCSDSNLKQMKEVVIYCVNQKDLASVKACNSLTLQIKHFTHICSKISQHRSR